MRMPAKILAFAGLLAPPVIWAAHWGLLYWAVSLELTLSRTVPVSGVLVFVLTVAALLALGLVVWRARAFSPDGQKPGLRTFWLQFIHVGALIAGAGIVYSALPLMMVPA